MGGFGGESRDCNIRNVGFFFFLACVYEVDG